MVLHKIKSKAKEACCYLGVTVVLVTKLTNPVTIKAKTVVANLFSSSDVLPLNQSE